MTTGIFRNSQSRQEDTCLCIMRRIPDIEQHLDDPKAPKFIDLATGNGHNSQVVDSEAQQLLGQLRENKVPTSIEKGNLAQVSTRYFTLR